VIFAAAFFIISYAANAYSYNRHSIYSITKIGTSTNASSPVQKIASTSLTPVVYCWPPRIAKPPNVWSLAGITSVL